MDGWAVVVAIGETRVIAGEEKPRRDPDAFNRRAYEDAPVAYLVLDERCRIRVANRAAAELFGATTDDLAGRLWMDLCAHSRAGKGHATELQQRLFAGENVARVEVELRRDDGALLWGEVSARAVRNAEGELSEILLVVADVTRFKVAEENLLETETNFHVMAEYAPVSLWMTDVTGGCSFVNQTWLKYTGRTMAAELGMGWTSSIHDEDRPISRAAFRGALEAQRPFSVECRMRRGDGEYRWMLNSGTPRFNGKNEFIGFVGASVDITDSKEARETLLHTNDDLQSAVRTRDDFMSIASHELRTPLTVLVLQLAGMRRLIASTDSGGGDTRLATKLEKAEWQTGRLENLIDNLLDMSRISVGKLQPRREKFDISLAVTEVVNRSSEQARRNGTKIELHAQPGAIGEWDKLRMEQVVLNLLSNALKYGAGKPVSVSVEANADTVTLTVQDHGVGIAKEDMARIFKRFERAVSARNYGGLGLGLYIVDQIVEAHGGSVSVESAIGEGATFSVVLPRTGAPIQNTASSAASGNQDRDD